MQMAASALTGCEQETFAFGSTPFTTWARVSCELEWLFLWRPCMIEHAWPLGLLAF